MYNDSMTTPDDHPVYAAINAKLAVIAASIPAPPWHEAWARLRPRSTDRERLAVYQAVRAACSVPAEAGFFLVALVLELLTDERVEEGLHAAEERLESIRQKYGLEEDTPADAGEVPAEYRAAMQQVHDAWDALYATSMEEFGEQQMVQLFRTDREQFDQLYETGRQFFHGLGGETDSEEDDAANDAWLDGLYEAVAGCVEADSPMGPLGLRYRVEDGFWEVWVYPTPVELVGGAFDGKVVAPGFTLDLEEMRSAFDSVVAFSWNALALNWPEGPHVSIEGVFQGREVYLQVLAYAPEGEEPGLKLDTTKKPRQRD
jgi:hypothetical protein